MTFHRLLQDLKLALVQGLGPVAEENDVQWEGLLGIGAAGFRERSFTTEQRDRVRLCLKRGGGIYSALFKNTSRRNLGKSTCTVVRG